LQDGGVQAIATLDAGKVRVLKREALNEEESFASRAIVDQVAVDP
jgi:hypothetical protein